MAHLFAIIYVRLYSSSLSSPFVYPVKKGHSYAINLQVYLRIASSLFQSSPFSKIV